MFTKNLTIEAMDAAGKGLARLATLSAVDHDGDTYAPGAFGWKDGGQWAPLLTAHDRWGMPFGKARVYEEGDAAFAELHINMETQVGKEWHAALKFDLDNGQPVQEWSYGYDVLQAEMQFRGKGQVRQLMKLDVQEVSTVVRGAGAGTRTLAIKSAALKEHRFAGLMAELGAMASAVERDPAMLSATGRKQLEDIHTAMTKTLKLPADLDEKSRAEASAAIADDLQLIERRIRA